MSLHLRFYLRVWRLNQYCKFYFFQTYQFLTLIHLSYITKQHGLPLNNILKIFCQRKLSILVMSSTITFSTWLNFSRIKTFSPLMPSTLPPQHCCLYQLMTSFILVCRWHRLYYTDITSWPMGQRGTIYIFWCILRISSHN